MHSRSGASLEAHHSNIRVPLRFDQEVIAGLKSDEQVVFAAGISRLCIVAAEGLAAGPSVFGEEAEGSGVGHSHS